MRIKIDKDIEVESRTLFRIEWRTFYPVLVIHEKFERHLKWTLRVIALVGIATSVISIDKWYYSLGFAILIFLVEQFFERAGIEYTTMVIQPFPDFKVEYGQWKTNGFMIPMVKNGKDLVYFGPSYEDKPYAIRFFSYLRSWVDNSSNDDKDNNLVVSLVIEPNEKYTTYFYANLGRERLKHMFKYMGDQSKLTKYGKQQQQFIAQMFYWHTLDFKDGYYIKRFLDFQGANEPFYFTPSVVEKDGRPLEFLFEQSIKKYEFKLKYRHELGKHDPEYNFNPKDYREDGESSNPPSK